MENSEAKSGLNKVKSDRSRYNPQTGRLAFKRVYQNKLAPLLKKYEKERVSTLAFCMVFCSMLAIFGIIIMFEVGITCVPHICLLVIGVSFLLWKLTKKTFEQKIKKEIMPTVCKCIGNLNWDYYYKGSSQMIQNSYVIYHFKSHVYDDYFYGNYKDVNIEVIGAKYIFEGEKALTFDGAIIILDLNKKSEGHTVIAEKGKQSYKTQRLKETSLEDIEFNKQYTVFTNDEVEARYLLTPSFMERLKNIKNVFQAKYVSCSFYQGKLYIALNTGKDLFALGALTRSVKDPEPYYQMFDEIYSIMKLVKHFKLNEKTGL